MKRLSKKLTFLIIAVVLVGLSSCRKFSSTTTGWEYNNPKNGGFEVSPFIEQETGSGLVFIEGGTFVMGRTEQEVNYEWDNIPRRVTVSSFYMDEAEVTNLAYLEYIYWLGRVYGTDYPEVVKKALPDSLCWRSKLAYNEPYVEYYFRHPAYHFYPVVGVNWVQATDYCAWRTDRVNERILIDQGILTWDPDQVNENNFNTAAYLAGQYEGIVKQDLVDLNPSGSGTRKVRMEDGIMLPSYRLPTEAEWEFAALGLIGNTLYERVLERRIYPWNGHVTRTDDKKAYGDFVANYKRGRGDLMGVAGNLNDGADITAPVYSYWPNDYGLYHMAGNVSEWVMDVYRPLSPEDVDDFRSFRGNVYQTKKLDEEGFIAEKDSLGRLIMRDVTEEENMSRRNYNKANNINFLDGDNASNIDFANLIGQKTEEKTGLEQESKNQELFDETGLMYDNYLNPPSKPPTTQINDKARVYKGGSWKDKAYWLSPGTRRFLDENQSTDFIGFRCAMTRVGTPFLGGK